MLKFFRNILNTYKSKKLSNFMKDNSIEFHDVNDLNILFEDYLKELGEKDDYLNIAKEKFRNYQYDRFNINARDFIVEYSKKNKLYKIVQNVKNILDSDSGQMANGEIKSTYYHKIYPHARETGSTQRGAVDGLRENIDKIDKYVSECERLKLEVGTCID
mgnify:CR=1 FL=1